MEYTIDDLLSFIERHDEHEGYYREQLIRKVKAEALEDLPLDGLRQAVRVLRGIEHHWSADSVAEVVTLIDRAAAIRGEQ